MGDRAHIVINGLPLPVSAPPDPVGTGPGQARVWPPPAESTVPLALPQRRVSEGRLRGRDGLVTELTVAAARRGSGDPQVPGVWLLSGMGGCGKTTVALETAHQLADASTRVWWVSGSDGGELFSALRAVAFAAGARPADFARAHPADVLWNRLNALTTPWLLVLDNVDDPAVLAIGPTPTPRRTGWLREPDRPPGTVLITSRESRGERWGDWVHMVGVGLLSNEDGARVLVDWAPQAGTTPESTAQEAEELAEHLGGLPLALDLAGSYLARALASTWPSPEVPDTFVGYRHSFDARLADMASDPDIDLDPRERTRRALVSTWELSLDHLHGQQIDLARPLLRLLCAFGPAPLPYLALLDSGVLSRSELFEDPDRTRLHKALDGLAGLRLVTVEVTRLDAGTRGGDTQRRVTIHPMVRAAGRAHPDFTAQAPQLLGLVTELLLRVTGPLQSANPADWPMWRAIAPHCDAAHRLLSACEHRLDGDMDPDLVTAATEPSVGAAEYHNYVGMYGEAISALGLVCATRTRLLGGGHPATIAARLQLAWALRGSGDLTGADQLYEEVARAAADALPAGHPYLQSVRTGRARTLRELGQYEQAEQELNAALAMRRRDPQTAPIGILRIRHDLAMLAHKRGRYEEAVVELRDIVRRIRSLAMEGDLDTPTVEVSLTRALRDAGYAEEAAGTVESALETYLRVLAPDHPHVLLARHERARLLRDHEEEPELLERAREEFEHIWRTSERRLGSDHPDVIAARHELATAWHLLGRPDLAAEHFREALEAGKRRLGEDHPDVVVAARNLANLLGSPPPYEGSTMNDERGGPELPPYAGDLTAITLEDALSPERDSADAHPDTARILSRFVRPRLSRGGANPAGAGFSGGCGGGGGGGEGWRSRAQHGPLSPTYRPSRERGGEHASETSFPSHADLRILATGQEDQIMAEQLRARQRGARLLALGELLRRADLPEYRRSDTAPMISRVRDLLLEADDRSQSSVTAVLLHPSVGRWLSRALRALYRDPVPVGPSAPSAADLLRLHAVAAAVAVRAELVFTLPLPVRDGFVSLPSLGAADLRSAGNTTARITAAMGEAQIRCGDTTVRLPERGSVPSPGWIPLPYVRTPAEGFPAFRLVLDDIDPYRETDGPTAPSRLSPPEVERWQQQISEAGKLLVETVPRQTSAAMATALTTLTPRPEAPGDVMTSISGSESFGGAILSSPPDAVELASTLIHEFGHMKLNAVLDSVDLYVKAAEEPEEEAAVKGPLYYAPWRDDPRPLPGFFQGVFAFFGVVDFWRRLSHRAEWETLRRSRFQWLYWRQQTLDAYAVLCASPRLTETGRQFTAMMRESTDSWTDHTAVPYELAALASDAVLTHRVRWRLHHLRPEAGAVAELADAWASGAPRPPGRPAVTVHPDPEVPSLNEHTALLCRAAAAGRVPPWPLPADPTARLLLTLRGPGAETGDTAVDTAAAIRSLTHCPEIVRGVHDRIATLTGSPPALAELAAWIDIPDGAAGSSDLPSTDLGH
ncbi:ATP/GTP-binding protein [Streptomyces venezuelae]|uniref:ATP/GTP-binding protein n=1 Tax=Streptomyces venezuelae TaxID=54571 RepID=A0A5P2CWS4_STRVZ|nr:HEXXH motif-containing putative peptide modification protein [Streptomyces venezuelae]QES47352.1 ATP/GTP-binding protein [Streptomyces venezuelae]